MDQAAAADRRGKEKGDLGFGEGQRRALMGDDPGEQHGDEQHHRASGFDQRVTIRRGEERQGLSPRARPEERAEEIPVEVEPADNAAHEVLGLLEPLDPHHRAVLDRVILEVEEGGDHSLAFSASLVARKKTSSRLASPAWAENFWVISASVPWMIFRPFFRIRMWEQISSTRCNRWELMMMAAPSRARLRMESFMRRMPRGSRPVSGSSK